MTTKSIYEPKFITTTQPQPPQPQPPQPQINENKISCLICDKQFSLNETNHICEYRETFKRNF